MREIWFVCPGCGEKVQLKHNYPFPSHPNTSCVAYCECEKCGWRSPCGKGKNEEEAKLIALRYLNKLAERLEEDVRPIDANALKKALKKYCKRGDIISEFKSAGIMIAIDEIERQPTFETESVIHAHWVDACIKGEYFCSNCCQTAPYSRERNEYYKTDYCGLCGAKMDEATEDNPTD